MIACTNDQGNIYVGLSHRASVLMSGIHDSGVIDHDSGIHFAHLLALGDKQGLHRAPITALLLTEALNSWTHQGVSCDAVTDRSCDAVTNRSCDMGDCRTQDLYCSSFGFGHHDGRRRTEGPDGGSALLRYARSHRYSLRAQLIT